MNQEQIKPCCTLAVEHAALLVSEPLQDLTREVVKHVREGSSSTFGKYVLRVHEMEAALTGSPDQCLIRALHELLRMTIRSKKPANRHDYTSILSLCSAVADNRDRVSPRKDGSYLEDEWKYHNQVLKPLMQ